MAKRNPMRVEHVQQAPAGWKVRTLTTPTGHEVRLAFPPGRRKKGSGRLVEILHPHAENPEGCNGPNRHSNPSEILIMGLGNPHKRKAEKHKSKTATRGHKNPKVVTEAQAEAMQQKAIDFLDRIDADDPNDIAGMSVSEYAEHKHLKLSNASGGKKKQKREKPKTTRKTKKNVARRRNSEASDLAAGKKLYRGFHGKEPERVRDLAIATEVQKTYVFGGGLAAARFLQDDGHEWKVKFTGDDIKLCSSPQGNQLYCIGGNQDLLDILNDQGVDTTKDLVSIGRWYCVYYDAAKSVTNFDMTEWEHYFGCREEIDKLLQESEEKNWSSSEFQNEVEKVMKATPPLERDLAEALYDTRNKRILFAGGSYYVSWPGIVG